MTSLYVKGTDSSLIELLPRERPSDRNSEPKPKLRRMVEFNPQVAPHVSDSEWCGAGQSLTIECASLIALQNMFEFYLKGTAI